MAPLTSFDIAVGLAALAVAVFAVYLFVRASSSSGKTTKPGQEEGVSIVVDNFTSPKTTKTRVSSSEFQVPKIKRQLAGSDVDKARSNIRTMTLKQELLSMVLKRLFEAEDEGEITRDERVSLSQSYESELKSLSEELKQSELIVNLHELESIRDDILQKFEATLNSTQSRIDTIMKELKLEEKKPTPPPRRRRTPEKVDEATEVAEDEGDGMEEPRTPMPKSDVEAKLQQLRMEVLKELEELEKLELEV
jgi:hypothetical protein